MTTNEAREHMVSDTFTIKEMREAYAKACRGEPLSDKEQGLALAKHRAIYAGWAQECREYIEYIRQPGWQAPEID